MKLQYYLLAIIDSSLRVIDEDSLSDIAQHVPRPVFECFHCFQGTNFNILFVVIFNAELTTSASIHWFHHLFHRQ